MQKDGLTALLVACKEGDTDIVTQLLAVPSVNVNVAHVSCVSGTQTPACRYELHCWEVSQDGWMWGRVSLEVDCVDGGLWLMLLCAGGWLLCADGGL